MAPGLVADVANARACTLNNLAWYVTPLPSFIPSQRHHLT